MKNNTLRYPAIFYPDGDGISVYFPDLDTSTCGDDMDHAYEMAKENLEIWVEENRSVFPLATTMGEALQKLRTGEYDDEITKHDEKSLILPVEVDLEFIKAIIKINASIPAWMKAEADKQGLNISEVLQNALLKELVNM